MSPSDRESVYVRVTDRAGNEFIFTLEALKDPATATEDELDHCVDAKKTGTVVSSKKRTPTSGVFLGSGHRFGH